MFWGGFGYKRKTALAKVPTRMDSEGYQQLLQTSLLPYANRIADRGWIYQQDNAPVHVSRSTRDWFTSKKMRVMQWPAKSPDLNPMENLWGIMVRNVYRHGRQYNSLVELEAAIRHEWEAIPIETLHNLNQSMKRRIFDVVYNHGKFIK